MKEEKKTLLAICIPTYNGGNTLIDNVEKILECNDDRFIVHVNDNLSKDETLSRLNEIERKDSRLKITVNDKIEPAFINYNNVLLKAEAEYVYFIIDKERINPNYIKDLLNFLEERKPHYGIVRKNSNIENGYKVYHKGLDAIKSISHFGNTHPCGLFYKKKLYKEENKIVMKFAHGGGWWIPDMTSLCLGFKYDGVIYYSSIYDFDYSAVLGGMSKSQSTLEKLYFYGKNRCEDYRTFLNLILFHDKSKTVIPIINALNVKYLRLVTYDQKRYFSDKQRCLHYGVEPRDVSYSEMLHWCNEIKNILRERCKKENIPVSNIHFHLYVIYSLFWAFLYDKPFLKKLIQPVIKLALIIKRFISR